MEIRNEIIEKIDRLPADLQQRVLDFVSSLDNAPAPRGMSGTELMKFAGIWDAETAKEIREAIEDCERIDPDGW